LLVAGKEKAYALASLNAAQENLKESEKGVGAGNLLDVAMTSAKANMLQAREALLAAETRIADLSCELNDLMGRPIDEPIEVTDAGLPEMREPPRDEAYDQAMAKNGELSAARQKVEKDQHAVRAARYDYIPDVTIFAKHGYQDGAPMLPNNIGIFGVEVSWNIFDWGKRKGEIGQRVAQEAQDRENLHRVQMRISIDLDKAHRKVERTRMMMDATLEALAACQENARLSENRLKSGTVTQAKHEEAVAALKKAEMDDLQATLEHRLALAELDRITGTLAANR
jgi:outer membrane protein TolC